MARATAVARSVATTRAPVLPYMQAWNFDGAASRASNASVDLSAYNKLVISGWLRIANGTGAIIFETTASFLANDAISINQTNGVISGGYSQSGSYCVWNSAQVAYNRWTHVAVVLDRTVAAAVGAKVYINGVLSGASSLASAAGGGTFNGAASLGFGSRGPGSSAFFKGLMKDWAIHSFTSFSATDALTLFSGVKPSTCTLVNRWEGADADFAATAADSVGTKTLTLTSVTYTSEVPTTRRVATRDIQNALLFPATSSRLSIPNTAGLRPGSGGFALSFWFRHTGAGTVAAIVQGGTSSVASWSLLLASATQMNVYVQSGGPSATFSTGLPWGRAGTWSRIFVTFSDVDRKIRVYVNGGLIGISAAISAWNITDTAATEAGLTTNSLNGSAGSMMSDLCFYKGTVPSASDVAADYFDGIQAPNCVHRYALTEGSGTAPVDSIAGNTASMTGGTPPTYTTTTPMKARSAAT